MELADAPRMAGVSQTRPQADSVSVVESAAAGFPPVDVPHSGMGCEEDRWGDPHKAHPHPGDSDQGRVSETLILTWATLIPVLIEVRLGLGAVTARNTS